MGVGHTFHAQARKSLKKKTNDLTISKTSWFSALWYANWCRVMGTGHTFHTQTRKSLQEINQIASKTMVFSIYNHKFFVLSKCLPNLSKLGAFVSIFQSPAEWHIHITSMYKKFSTPSRGFRPELHIFATPQKDTMSLPFLSWAVTCLQAFMQTSWFVWLKHRYREKIQELLYCPE